MASPRGSPAFINEFQSHYPMDRLRAPRNQEVALAGHKADRFSVN